MLRSRILKKFSSLPEYKFLKTCINQETLLIELHRPKVLNAINTDLFQEFRQALILAENIEEVKSVVVTGSKSAFAAGVDIKEMSSREFSFAFGTNMYDEWKDINYFR